MSKPYWYPVVVITTGGREYRSKAYATDKEMARRFAASWAKGNGHNVSRVVVLPPAG